MTDFLSHSDLHELATNRLTLAKVKPAAIWPWFQPHVVKVLLVTDGLNFGDGDFGLSCFITTLLDDGRHYVRFEVTLGHLQSAATDEDMLLREPRIAKRIKGFRFDVAAHFTPTTFDEVFLFGVTTNYADAVFGARSNVANGYPADRLKNSELDALTAHMNSGRGLFATGDHARLGKGLCGSVDRARDMRYWADFGPGSGDEIWGPGQLSMRGINRNDSNMVGNDGGTQFSDQSDDIPQKLDLKLYHSWLNFFKEERYPHPILCAPSGRIDVFPDHPHEGQVKVPDNLGLACRDGSPEYPPATDGSGQVVPEVIATGRVPAGNRAGTGASPGFKMATVAHSFAVLAAYDGHRAGVGRVVTDSTWHHFVNVNLIGIFEGGGFDDFSRLGEDPNKHTGFLSSVAGQAHLAKIRHYYVNTAVWLVSPLGIVAMNEAIWWDLIWTDRVVEATINDPALTLRNLSLIDLYQIGSEARDVLGRRTSVCRTVHSLLEIFDKVWEEFVPLIDPWRLVPVPDPFPVPWFDPNPLMAIVLGGAIVAMRDQFPYPTAKAVQLNAKAAETRAAGADYALRFALDAMGRDLEQLGALGASRLERRSIDEAKPTRAAAPPSAKGPRPGPRTKVGAKPSPSKRRSAD